MAKKSGYSTISKVLIMQASIALSITIGFLAFGTENMALSSIIGGLTAFLPNLYFAYRISLSKGESAKKIVQSFYSGESRKVLMTCALFAVAFQVPGVQFLPLMVCFVAVLSVFWLALILFVQDFEYKSVRKDG
mgnify:FL=1